jgi:hypothetical protein
VACNVPYVIFLFVVCHNPAIPEMPCRIGIMQEFRQVQKLGLIAGEESKRPFAVSPGLPTGVTQARPDKTTNKLAGVL